MAEFDWSCGCGQPHCDQCGQVLYCIHISGTQRQQAFRKMGHPSPQKRFWEALDEYERSDR